MSNTYKHKWKYRVKKYYERMMKSYHPIIIRDDEHTYIVSIPPKKEEKLPYNIPYYYLQNLFWLDSSAKWIKKHLWQSHRAKWKQALHKEDWFHLERLPVKPEDYSWIIN